MSGSCDLSQSDVVLEMLVYEEARLFDALGQGCGIVLELGDETPEERSAEGIHESAVGGESRLNRCDSFSRQIRQCRREVARRTKRFQPHAHLVREAIGITADDCL